jgi:hypothetical protein
VYHTGKYEEFADSIAWWDHRQESEYAWWVLVAQPEYQKSRRWEHAPPDYY